VKARSSGWIRDTFPDLPEFAWQNGYGWFSVSQSGAGAVREYIARQEEHHRTMTFKEELVALLERHEIEYDPRDLWD
jgi:REP-associated tyrosine transposase